jgi:hypothetical protein
MFNCKYLTEASEGSISSNSFASLVLYAVLIAGAAGVAYIIREAFFVDAKKVKKVFIIIVTLVTKHILTSLNIRPRRLKKSLNVLLIVMKRVTWFWINLGFLITIST